MTDFADQVADIGACIADIRREVSKVVVGQTSMIDGLLIGLLTGGHVLLEGVRELALVLLLRPPHRVGAASEGDFCPHARTCSVRAPSCSLARPTRKRSATRRKKRGAAACDCVAAHGVALQQVRYWMSTSACL